MATNKPVKRIKLPSKGKSKVVEETESTFVQPEDQPQEAHKEPKTSKSLSFMGAPWRYVKGSWQELRQVRWPNRRASWGLTLAVIVFTLFFSGVILLLDFIFNYLFKEVILK